MTNRFDETAAAVNHRGVSAQASSIAHAGRRQPEPGRRNVRLRTVSEDLTGRSLGHYRVDEVLGRGGMSVLYRATDVRLGRKVALKVMGEHITGDAEFRERFADEARNTSAIDHANVVPLYDFGEVDGMLYIAMRLVDGADKMNTLVFEYAPQVIRDRLDRLVVGRDSVPHEAVGRRQPVQDIDLHRARTIERGALLDQGLGRVQASGAGADYGDVEGLHGRDSAPSWRAGGTRTPYCGPRQRLVPGYGQATQNSFPSGSAIVTHQCGPCDALCRYVAPRSCSLATSASTCCSPTLTSRCTRFFTVFCSGKRC